MSAAAEDRMNEYRFLVRVRNMRGSDYVTVVEVDGPKPQQAVIDALTEIDDRDNDLWMRDELTVTVERVR